MSTATNEGKIVQCIGAVIDVEFSRNSMPKVYDALTMEGSELEVGNAGLLVDRHVMAIAAQRDCGRKSADPAAAIVDGLPEAEREGMLDSGPDGSMGDLGWRIEAKNAGRIATFNLTRVVVPLVVSYGEFNIDIALKES